MGNIFIQKFQKNSIFEKGSHSKPVKTGNSAPLLTLMR